MNAAVIVPVSWNRSLELPWAHHSFQDRRFRRIQMIVLAIILLLSLLFWILPAPQLPKSDFVDVPRPIQLVMDVKPLPPPVAKPEPVVPPAPKETPKAVVTERPEPVRSPRPGSAPPAPTARERAAAAGINDLAHDLASLRDASEVSKAITGRPDLTGKPNIHYTSDLNGGTAEGPGSERSLITARAGQSSGGINTAGMSRGFGGGGLAGRGTTLVTGYGGGGTGTGKGTVGIGSGNGTGTGDGNGTGSGSGGSRSREEIEMIFDQNKGAIYALYNRALRENPSLRGKLVLRLTILPNGVVSACDVVSSELNAPDFEHRLAQRVLLFKFQARDVSTVTTTKPIDFFPS